MKTRLTHLTCLFLLASAGSLLAKPEAPALAPLARLPLFFEPNRGQAAPGVQYIARSRSGTFLLGATGAVVNLVTAAPSSAGPHARVGFHKPPPLDSR